MKPDTSWMKLGLVLALVTVCLSSAATSSAQVQTTETSTAGASAVQVNVERGEVVAVEGNDLMVKMEDGTIRHFPNIPDRATITVDGKQLTVFRSREYRGANPPSLGGSVSRADARDV